MGLPEEFIAPPNVLLRELPSEVRYKAEESSENPISDLLLPQPFAQQVAQRLGSRTRLIPIVTMKKLRPAPTLGY